MPLILQLFLVIYSLCPSIAGECQKECNEDPDCKLYTIENYPKFRKTYWCYLSSSNRITNPPSSTDSGKNSFYAIKTNCKFLNMK